jgi:hypothetical protein
MLVRLLVSGDQAQRSRARSTRSRKYGLAGGVAISAQDRYALKVPGGLAFSEFKGYEAWEVISISHNGDKLAVIRGNPLMIQYLRPAAAVYPRKTRGSSLGRRAYRKA